jgi:hypothetical protein
MHVRTVGAIWVAGLLVLFAGCGSPGNDHPVAGGSAAGAGERRTADETSHATGGRAPTAGRVFLTVDFQQGQTLRYKFTSQRNMIVDWDPNAPASTNHAQEQSESFEMVVAYTPVEVDPYGVSTIHAVVESVKTQRQGGPGARDFGADAVQVAQGQDFTLKVDPRGKVVDATSLTTLIQEMGKRAFRPDMSRGRVKEPDMIWDFIASQWFLWDAEASVERPAEGVVVGQTWPSQLCVPTPMVVRWARNVVYKLAEVRESPWRGRPALASRGHPGLAASDCDAAITSKVQGQDALATWEGATGPVAVVQSTYTPAVSAPAGWPIPYSGRFQVSRTFGLLVSYEILGLQGTGQELFNLRTGRVEQRREKYTLRVKAGLPPLGIKAHPRITIEQTLTMELVKPEIRSSNTEIRDKSE